MFHSSKTTISHLHILLFYVVSLPLFVSMFFPNLCLRNILMNVLWLKNKWFYHIRFVHEIPGKLWFTSLPNSYFLNWALEDIFQSDLVKKDILLTKFSSYVSKTAKGQSSKDFKKSYWLTYRYGRIIPLFTQKEQYCFNYPKVKGQ